MQSTRLAAVRAHSEGDAVCDLGVGAAVKSRKFCGITSLDLGRSGWVEQIFFVLVQVGHLPTNSPSKFLAYWVERIFFVLVFGHLPTGRRDISPCPVTEHAAQDESDQDQQAKDAIGVIQLCWSLVRLCASPQGADTSIQSGLAPRDASHAQSGARQPSRMFQNIRRSSVESRFSTSRSTRRGNIRLNFQSHIVT